jgi:hypothetical protein
MKVHFVISSFVPIPLAQSATANGRSSGVFLHTRRGERLHLPQLLHAASVLTVLHTAM